MSEKSITFAPDLNNQIRDTGRNNHTRSVERKTY